MQSQAPVLKFKHITREQGLSNSTIEIIFQDSRGFMWFGTRDGLNRYDGHQMTVFKNNPLDTNSLSDNFIRYLYEDHRHRMWIGTKNGLNLFDKRKNTFTRYLHADNKNSISNNQISCIYEDKNNLLWISTVGGGLDVFNEQNNRFSLLKHRSGVKGTLSNDGVNYIFEDKSFNFWIATRSGLDLLDRKTGKFTLYQNLTDNSRVYLNNIFLVIKQDKQGNLWLGTEDSGLALFNIVKKTFTQFRHNDKISSSLGSDMVKSIFVDQAGRVWVGSINGGLDLFNPATNTFFHYQNAPDNAESLSQKTVSAIYQDNESNLWVGTHRGGINLYTPKAEKFQLYQQETRPNSLSYYDVTAFCEDRKGNIWIGTDYGGLNLFDKNKDVFTHYRYNPYNPQSLSSDAILDIMEDHRGNLWLSTWGGGINLFNAADHTFKHFLNDPNDKTSISSNHVQKTFEDSKGNLWVATYYGGLNLLNPQTYKFTRFTQDPSGKTSLFGNNVVSINEDSHHNLWIGTDDGGLNCYDLNAQYFSHYFNTGGKSPDIRFIFNDKQGRLWVGQTGLYLFDYARKKFSLYTNKAGLSTEFIKGITQDDKGNLWISTSNGLTKFNPVTYAYNKFNTGDGLQGLEFEANACLKTRDGEMFFGGGNGFNAFYPDHIVNNNFIPPVYITDFQIFNKKILPGEKDSPLQNDISLTSNIILSYKQSTISFNFAALNYTVSDNNQYAYKLEGFDKDWNYAGKERKASYTNLNPGEYVFRVKASNNDRVWNEKGASVVITIDPPFWSTWWFRTLITLALIVLFYKWYQYRRSLEREKMEERKKEEMHQVQLQFFTNISHEFRTPLSLILGPIEKLKNEDLRTEFEHYYNTIHRNATRLMNLINELMDFRKVESGALKLKVMPGNLGQFLNDIVEEFKDLTTKKQITLTINNEENYSQTWFDRQVLEKIVLNLLHNSFKYTAEDGKINIEVFNSLNQFKPVFENELIVKNDYQAGSYFYIRVSDNGIGISKESIQHLFERYYRIASAHLGSGVGLAFVKSLTLMHKGNIYVYSERNKGTEVIIALPSTKESYQNDERWFETANEGAGVRLESINYKSEHHYIDPDNAGQPQNPIKAQGKEHVLIVDDNDELRHFIKESLSPFYHISEADNGNKGLIKAKDESPDLIISDVMMPVMDGIEFCRMIKNDIETSHIAFIMLTAKGSIEATIEGVESGADTYFSKPIRVELLLATIRNIFEQKNKLKERYFNNYHAEARELVHSTKDKQFMDKLINVINNELINPDLDVDYICQEIGMSRTKLYQKIKSISGQSIVEFVRSFRLKTALQIMTHEDVALSEVMYRVGIQTQSHFTKAFKKEFGKTPTQYLQDIRQ